MIWLPCAQDTAGMCTLLPWLCCDRSPCDLLGNVLLAGKETVLVEKLKVGCVCKDVQVKGWMLAL